MDNTLRIGSVGTSSIMKLIQEAIALTDGLETKVIYSRDAERGRKFAEEVGVPESCSDYSNMVKRDDLDIIYIASPNSLHFGQALEALENKKHVIIEKPAAVTQKEVDTLYEAAKKNGVFFFEAVTTLFMPNYLAYKKLIPEIGKLNKVYVNYGQYSSKYDAYLRGENPNIFNPELQGGALNDMGIYCIHVAVDLFGDPETVQYTAEYGPNGADVCGNLFLTYPDLICQIETSKKHSIKSGCFLTGENGSLSEEGALNDFANCESVIDGIKTQINVQSAGNRMVYEMAIFRDAIFEHDTEFFEKMAAQSSIAASILDRAHTN
ncbi:MAG: Gfo/Idh/MocA family oxidoreductase [Schaedlerella sp.]|nr:Gfo/Idh/MocA family oxidoreductase [Schaedlerella sp.]